MIYAEINIIFIYSANMCGAELINSRSICSSACINTATKKSDKNTIYRNIFHSPGRRKPERTRARDVPPLPYITQSIFFDNPISSTAKFLPAAEEVYG